MFRGRTAFYDRAGRMTSARLVLTTTGDRREAKRIAHTLVTERLAACVNIVDRVHSIYRWKDAVESSDEVLLLIKTEQDRVEALRTRLHELHSYELPEFLVLHVAEGSSAYLDWVGSCVR